MTANPGERPRVAEYVAGLLFYDHAVALVLKARPEWQRGRWNGVGGHIEQGETPLTAMRREFEEETGVEIEPWEHFATLEGVSDSGGAPWRVWWFRAEAGELHGLEGAPDEPVWWHNVDDLPPTIPNIHWLVRMAQHEQRHDWPLRIVEPSPLERTAK